MPSESSVPNVPLHEFAERIMRNVLCAVFLPIVLVASSVKTDRTGYQGGESVGIHASGFKPYEAVTIRIQSSQVAEKTDQVLETQEVVADANGKVSTSWRLEERNRTGEKFEVLAQGQISGLPAKSEFKRIAVIETDKFDYNPRSDAVITGSGFYPMEEVLIHVTHLNEKNNGAGHEPFTVIADASGRVKATWYVNPDDSPRAIFRLTAVGRESGLKAVSTFTDPPITIVDDQGADDEPGQKDLNQLSVDFTLGSGVLGITWNLDDTAWSGANTGDACSLFDTDSDGFANFSLCETVSGDPATHLATRLYSCGDTRSDRCASPALVSPFTSTCTSGVVANSDPFRIGFPAHVSGNTCGATPGCYSADAVAACTVRLSDFGNPSGAFLLNVCTYPSQEPNSDPSDCVVTPNSGFLTIVKNATPNDGTAFSFTTTRTSQSGLSQFTINGSGSVPLISFAAGTLDITEAVPSGWNLDSASCTVAGQSTGTKNGNTIGSVLIRQGLETVCTFNDSRVLPKLTVTKIVNNNFGGTKTVTDFVLKVDGGQVTSGQQNTFSVGGHTVSEDAVAGYTGVIGGDCAANGSITLNYGDVKACTITNTDVQPKLIVIKHVVNDNGGSATASNFTMSVSAASPSPSSFPGAESPGTTVMVSAGAYSVSETGPSGYAASFSPDCSGSIAVGETKTCTVTNDDIAGTLIVIKHVVNNNGGTASAASFTMSVTGNNPSPPSFPGVEAPGTSVSINAGGFKVSETGPSGYAASYSADCEGTLAIGQTKTCTVTNDDIQPRLYVIKHVINDNGGSAIASDFTMSVTASSPAPASFPGTESPGTLVLLNAGAFSVSETGPSGYAASFTGCSGTIAVGETKTCTVDNNDQTATITLVKYVVNNNGGTANANNFPIRLDGTLVAWGAPINVNAGAHTVAETVVSGYAASTWGGACSGTATNGSFNIALGQNLTCTITNDDIAPSLTITKVCNPTTDTGRFNLLIDSVGSTNTACGQSFGPVPVNAGNHVVSETAGLNTNLADYVSAISGACAANGSVTLALGQTATCYITNTRRGDVSIIKSTNGVVGAVSWSFSLYNGTTTSGTPVRSGTTALITGALPFTQLAPGTYTLCESGLPAGWFATWNVNGSNVSPFNPDGSENLGRLCYTFTIAAAGTVDFRINNFTPQGTPRTIGYWRNWNRCTSGNQAATADRNGGPAEGFYLLENVLPQAIGDLSVTTCEQGVNILSKRDLTGGNRANDAAYSLAAQLLAARANLAAQAVQCTDLTAALNAAQALLDSINFIGTGSYLPPNTSLQTARADALKWAGVLDLYNNGGLCIVTP